MTAIVGVGLLAASAVACFAAALFTKGVARRYRVALAVLVASQMMVLAILCTLQLIYRLSFMSFVVYALLCCSCVPVDALLFRLFAAALKRDEDRERVRLLEEQRTALGERMELAQVELAKAADVYRQAADQIDGALAQLEAGDASAPSASLEAATDLVNTLAPRACEHHVVGALVEMKARRAEEAGVRLSLDLDVPESLPFSDTELCAVFSNLLDNALNACAAVEPARRVVEVRAFRRGGFFVVEVRNARAADAGAVRPRRERGTLTVHGWGLSIVEGIAQRHGGMVSTEAAEGEFRTTVALGLGRAQGASTAAAVRTRGASAEPTFSGA